MELQDPDQAELGLRTILALQNDFGTSSGICKWCSLFGYTVLVGGNLYVTAGNMNTVKRA